MLYNFREGPLQNFTKNTQIGDLVMHWGFS